MSVDLKSKTQMQLKIVLLGATNVGKSSLILNFIHGRFLEHEANTAGASYQFKMMDLGGELTKVQIWDTAGQERFSGFTSIYYRDTNGCMVVYDVMDKSSLERAVAVFLSVLSVNPKARFAVIGNKTDLATDFAVKQRDAKEAFYSSLQNNIDKEQIFHDLLFEETSAKLGTNVVTAFQHLAQHCLEIDTTVKEAQEGCCKKKKDKGMF